MHPPLTLSKHPLCRQNVQNLQKCHSANPWYEKWFLGKCNREKWELDECLKLQKIFKAQRNKEKGEKRVRAMEDEKKKEIHVLVLVTGSVAAMKWVELIHKITDEYFDDEVHRETTKLYIHSVATNAAKPFIEATEFGGAFPTGSLVPTNDENRRSLDQLRKKKSERNYPNGDGLYDEVFVKLGPFTVDGYPNCVVQNYNDASEYNQSGGWQKRGDVVTHIDLRNKADICVIAPCSANTLAKIANGLCDNLATSILRAWDFTKPLLIAPGDEHLHKHIDAIKENHGKQPFGDGVQFLDPIEKTLMCGEMGVGAMRETVSIARNVIRVLNEYLKKKKTKK
ncbi:unnamed protein product [Bathycoccus prasinos]